MGAVREQAKVMDSKSGSLPYHHMVEELREKLRISEEGRRSLQQKFDAMMQTYKVKEQSRYNALRKRYGAFLEEDQRRQQRNENLLQMLERIDTRSASLAARTERLAVLRKHYEQYLGQIYPSWKAAHRLTSVPLPVKIREYHEEDVSGYGTHTGSSGYARESERYEEPRMPPMSTPRANTHLFKTDNVLPDKYRIPRVDFDMPSIAVTKPDEEKRGSFGVRTPRQDLGRFESRLPDGATRSMAVSPRETTPREHSSQPREREHLSQPEFELDQNTSGDLLNMSLSDDGVPSLTRSETDAVARQHHWETLRQAYINRQQPHYNQHSSADEALQDMEWSRQRKKAPDTYDYRDTESERPLQALHEPTEQVTPERESFRDKIRRLKVMIQENKELERSVGDSANGNTNETDNAFQQQRVRRQSVVDGPTNPYAQKEEVANNNEDFHQQRTRRQSIVAGSENGYPRPEDRGPTGSTASPHQDENKMADGGRMSVLPQDKILSDADDYQRSEWAQGPEDRTNNVEDRSRWTEQPGQRTEPQQGKQNGGEMQLHKEEQNINPVQNVQYQEQNRNFAQNAAPEQYSSEQGHQRNSNEQMKGEQDLKNANLGQETRLYSEDNKTADPQTQPDNTGTSEQYYQEKTYGEEQQPPSQEQGYYGDPNQNYDAQAQSYNYSQGDYQPPQGNYYQQQSGNGDTASQEQKGYAPQNEQEYYQEKGYYGQQDQASSQYDKQYQQQYSNQYEDQQQYDPQQQQQQYDPQQQQQQYDPQPQQQQQYDPQQQQYDPQQQQQYDSKQQQQYDPQQQQQYDSKQQQQYDPQQQQYDPQQQQQYDTKQQQQYDPQQQYEPQQEQYDGQQQQYGADSYDWQQNSKQEQPGAQDQYQYYGQQDQEGYAYDPQSQGSKEYEYQQQNPNESYAAGNQQGTSREGQEVSSKYYPEISDDSTQESERSREMPMGRSQESPSQRSIDRYRTMLGVDPNSDPAYSEVDEIEDEMAAVVASGTGGSRVPPVEASPLATANVPTPNQPKTPETNPKELHEDSSDFDYSSGH